MPEMVNHVVLKKILPREHIILDFQAEPGKHLTKTELIETMCALILDRDHQDYLDLVEQVVMREKVNFTGIGNGVALAHGISKKAKNVSLTCVRLITPLDWDSTSSGNRHRMTDLIFLFIVPFDLIDAEDTPETRCLKQLVRNLGRPAIGRQLRRAESVDDFRYLLAGELLSSKEDIWEYEKYVTPKYDK